MRSPIHNSSIKNLKDGCVGINAMVELTQKVGPAFLWLTISPREYLKPLKIITFIHSIYYNIQVFTEDVSFPPPPGICWFLQCQIHCHLKKHYKVQNVHLLLHLHRSFVCCCTNLIILIFFSNKCIRNVKCPLWQIFCSSKNPGRIILLPCLVVEGTFLILKVDYVFGAVAVVDVIAIAAAFCCWCSCWCLFKLLDYPKPHKYTK